MTHFADSASSLTATILENETIAKDTMRLRVQAPDMAAQVLPGQFFMIRHPGSNDPLIGRAFALYDVSADGAGWLDLVYLVKGKLTTSVSTLRSGDSIAIWGPLGNGFLATETKHLVMVAGGIGQTPFLTLAREALGTQRFGDPAVRHGGYAQRVSFCYGVRQAEYLAGVEQFQAAGCDVHIATEDGSLGPPRRVTDVLRDLLERNGTDSTRIVCCGPEPMMEAVAKIAGRHEIPCEVSLETPMACGIGICFTCVAKVGTDQDWDYKRTCVEGPVFDARDIVWD